MSSTLLATIFMCCVLNRHWMCRSTFYKYFQRISLSEERWFWLFPWNFWICGLFLYLRVAYICWRRWCPFYIGWSRLLVVLCSRFYQLFSSSFSLILRFYIPNYLLFISLNYPALIFRNAWRSLLLFVVGIRACFFNFIVILHSNWVYLIHNK
jgi:hypothetical protein